MNADRNERCKDSSMYVLGGLNNQEREDFEQHLRQCPACRKEIAEMREVVQYLPLASEEAEPPAGMKSRILAHVLGTAEEPQQVAGEADSKNIVIYEAQEKNEPKRTRSQYRNRPTAWLSAACAILLIAAGVLAVNVTNLHEDKKTLLAEVTKLRGELVAGNEPSTGLQVRNVVSLKPTVKDLVAQGTAMIVIDSRGTHLIVQAEKLPELKGTEAFQVWLLKGGKPVNAGTFVTRDGTGALYFTFSPDDYDTIAITKEPDPNGKEPRGSIVLGAEI